MDKNGWLNLVDSHEISEVQERGLLTEINEKVCRDTDGSKSLGTSEAGREHNTWNEAECRDSRTRIEADAKEVEKNGRFLVKKRVISIYSETITVEPTAVGIRFDLASFSFFSFFGPRTAVICGM